MGVWCLLRTSSRSPPRANQQLAGAKGDGAVQFDERSIFLLSEEGEWLYRAPDANYKESVNVISKRKFKATAKTDKPSGFSAR